MLARLGRTQGIATVEADRTGELLRLRVESPAVFASAHTVLRELGYDATVPDPPPVATESRWYDASRVGELSREEARTLAHRIMSAYAAEGIMRKDALASLTDGIERAIARVLVSAVLASDDRPGELREQCVRAVEAVARPIVGDEGAEAIAAIASRSIGRPEARPRD